MMGDYSNDLMLEAIDYMGYGNYHYSEVDDSDPRDYCEIEQNNGNNIIINIGDDDIFDDSIFTHTKLCFKNIVKQTDKSWILEMSGGAIHHFSKKYCQITNDEIIVPKWLLRKMW